MNGDKPVYSTEEPTDELSTRSSSMESLHNSDSIDIEDLGDMETENLSTEQVDFNSEETIWQVSQPVYLAALRRAEKLYYKKEDFHEVMAS